MLAGKHLISVLDVASAAINMYSGLRFERASMSIVGIEAIGFCIFESFH